MCLSHRYRKYESAKRFRLFSFFRGMKKKAHKNTHGGNKHCDAMHLKQFDLTFRMLQHTFTFKRQVKLFKMHCFTVSVVSPPRVLLFL